MNGHLLSPGLLFAQQRLVPSIIRSLAVDREFDHSLLAWGFHKYTDALSVALTDLFIGFEITLAGFRTITSIGRVFEPFLRKLSNRYHCMILLNPSLSLFLDQP